MSQPAGCGRDSGRNSLDLAPDLGAPLELARAVARGVFEALLLERRRHAGPQDHGVERLREVVRRAELDGSRDGLDLVDRRDHDDRNRPEHRVGAHPLEDLEAVHLRHHDVEEDEVDRPRGQRLEGGASVHRGLDLVAERLEAAHQKVSIDLGVVDDEEAPRQRGDQKTSGRERHAFCGAAPRSCRRYGICFSAARSPSR